MVKPWPRSQTRRALFEHHVFNLYEEHHTSPRTGEPTDTVVLESADWVNVVALTKDDELVMIRQYRYGTQDITLEIPGGIIDPGESPFEAARRELIEETGFQAERWTSLGAIAPNPAIHRNHLHSYLAEGCTLVADQNQDPFEDIEVELVPRATIDGLVAGGQITHALVVVALHKLALLRAGHSFG